MPCMLRFLNSTTSARTRSCLQWLPASSRRRWREPVRPSAKPAFHSASITTRSSTRPRIFSTRSPTSACSAAFGADSTGATTRALWRATLPCYGIDRPQQSVWRHFHDARRAAGNCDGGCHRHPLTADEEFQAGFICNGAAATPTNPLAIGVPGVGVHLEPDQHSGPDTGDNDNNPPAHRAAQPVRRHPWQKQHLPRRRYKVDLDLTAINVTNKYALYNFLSTFSGTHYVTPRALTAKITFNF